ncbi:MAG TPA: zf-HC2 domain-containing protein [Candidatus Acidoferrum sp.]|nr:zf-HC2 domain-containing protein [Candidatus Acidoferrum sp.]
MKCQAVQTRLAGYLDYTVTGAARIEERVQIREHLDACAGCRAELERFRKLAVLLSRVPQNVPPPDLAVRIKVAAAQMEPTQNWRGRFRKVRDHAEILLDNVARPLTVPATGGFFVAIVVFALVFQMIAPGLTVRAVQNDTDINLMRPAEVLTLADYPESWAPEPPESDDAHGLLVDVSVNARGQFDGYEILSGPTTQQTRHQLDQILMFSSFRPMLSFGRPTNGGHVILSFSAVRVRG